MACAIVSLSCSLCPSAQQLARRQQPEHHRHFLPPLGSLAEDAFGFVSPPVAATGTSAAARAAAHRRRRSASTLLSRSARCRTACRPRQVGVPARLSLFARRARQHQLDHRMCCLARLDLECQVLACRGAWDLALLCPLLATRQRPPRLLCRSLHRCFCRRRC